MLAHPILLQKKYARVVALYAKKEHIGLDAALQKFYHLVTYKLMKNGISDMHCIRDDYLTEELKEEDAKELGNTGRKQECLKITAIDRIRTLSAL